MFTTDKTRMRQACHGIIATVAGWVLLAAAALKWLDLNEPRGVPTVFLIPAELFLGLWLLSGLYARSAQRLAALTFAAFCSFNIWSVINGASACGCFGPVRASPWIALVLDTGVLVGLLITRPAADDRLTARSHPGRFTIVCMTFALSLGAFGWAALSRHESGEEVLVRPEEWQGKPLPLLADIDIHEQLASGHWLLAFHRHDCEECRRWLPQWHQLARTRGWRLALVAVPPFPNADHTETGDSAVQGHLNPSKSWVFQTPVLVRLQDGEVISLGN